PRAKKVLELSLREALGLGHNYIGTEHILLGLVREGEGVAAQVLGRRGAAEVQVRAVVVDELRRHGAAGEAGRARPRPSTRAGEPWRPSPPPTSWPPVRRWGASTCWRPWPDRTTRWPGGCWPPSASTPTRSPRRSTSSVSKARATSRPSRPPPARWRCDSTAR